MVMVLMEKGGSWEGKTVVAWKRGLSFGVGKEQAESPRCPFAFHGDYSLLFSLRVLPKGRSPFGIPWSARLEL